MNERPDNWSRRSIGIAIVLAFALAAPIAAQTITPGDARSGADPRLRQILIDYVGAADSFEDRFAAEVWLSDMSRRLARQVPDPNERLRILNIVHREATRADLAPELVLAVIDVESSFDRYAISSASALGLMQIMPFWVREIGREVSFNILLGCRILKYYLDMEDGDLVGGLGRYNGSYGRRNYADRVIDRLRTKWFRS
jgi:soluble lytic murein transglycosylase-like protein